MSPSQRNGCEGFTLIEVLVAVLVLSIGLLGLAGLQTYSVASTHSAYLRSQATVLAYDIIDRMRANRAAVVAGNYLVAFGAQPATVTDCQSAGSTCSNADMAAFDLTQWKCTLGAWSADVDCANVTSCLPNGNGQITQNGNIYTVAVRWNDRELDNGASNVVTLQVSTEIGSAL
jgi:type IV pilus assembly protein PilV